MAEHTDLDQLVALCGYGPVLQTASALEKWLGHPLHPQLAAWLENPPDLWQADHPHIVDSSWLGPLPEVGPWLEQLRSSPQGHFRATVNFLGLLPVGVRLDRGDFLFAFALLDADCPGVLYYDEREVGGWSDGSLVGFLSRELRKYYAQVDERVRELRAELEDDIDRMPSDDEVRLLRPAAADLEDCFAFRGAELHGLRARTPSTDLVLEQRFAERCRVRQELLPKRVWVVPFLSGELQARHLPDLPRPSDWDAQKAEVATTVHSALYWLLAHTLLDNAAELAEAKALVADHPSVLVQNVAEQLNAVVAGRYAEQREALFDLARGAT